MRDPSRSLMRVRTALPGVSGVHVAPFDVKRTGAA
jgi:hypothetical protein